MSNYVCAIRDRTSEHRSVIQTVYEPAMRYVLLADRLTRDDMPLCAYLAVANAQFLDLLKDQRLPVSQQIGVCVFLY